MRIAFIIQNHYEYLLKNDLKNYKSNCVFHFYNFNKIYYFNEMQELFDSNELDLAFYLPMATSSYLSDEDPAGRYLADIEYLSLEKKIPTIIGVDYYWKRLIKEFFDLNDDEDLLLNLQKQGMKIVDMIEYTKSREIIEYLNKRYQINFERVPLKPEVKIFISYAKEDTYKAERIYNLLNQFYTVWFDEKNLLPGQRWNIEIEKSIKDSRFFIACLSKHSVSKTGYVQKELKKALEVACNYPENKIFIIPVLLEECTIPWSLQEYQYCKFDTYLFEEKIKAAIESNLS